MINLNDLRKKSKDDLKKELEKIEKEYRSVVSDILQRKEKNVRKSGSLRKDIARIKTLLNEISEDRDDVEEGGKKDTKEIKEDKMTKGKDGEKEKMKNKKKINKLKKDKK